MFFSAIPTYRVLPYSMICIIVTFTYVFNIYLRRSELRCCQDRMDSLYQKLNKLSAKLDGDIKDKNMYTC